LIYLTIVASTRTQRNDLTSYKLRIKLPPVYCLTT